VAAVFFIWAGSCKPEGQAKQSAASKKTDKLPNKTTVSSNVHPDSGCRRGPCPDDMCYVPAGEFIMGCYNTNNCNPDEYFPGKGWKRINLKAFCIDRTLVTNRDYELCVKAGRCAALKDAPCYGYKKGEKPLWQERPVSALAPTTFNPDYPAVCVNWQMAKQYCASLGRQLPTEAQFEKASRGTDGRSNPWNGVLSRKRTNYGPDIDWGVPDDKDGYLWSSPVDAFPDGKSPYGVLDMLGNVWQWTDECYKKDAYKYYSDTDPRIKDKSCRVRSARGASWECGADWMRSSNRYGEMMPRKRMSYFGIRCVLNLDAVQITPRKP